MVVAPFTGAWVEIDKKIDRLKNPIQVAPFTGAWVEISQKRNIYCPRDVAPFTGAWVEILCG